MRKIREVLRLTHEVRLSVRQVCVATGVGKTAVGEYVIARTGAGHHLADARPRSMTPSWSGGCSWPRTIATAVHRCRCPTGGRCTPS